MSRDDDFKALLDDLAALLEHTTDRETEKEAWLVRVAAGLMQGFALLSERIDDQHAALEAQGVMLEAQGDLLNQLGPFVPRYVAGTNARLDALEERTGIPQDGEQ